MFLISAKTYNSYWRHGRDCVDDGWNQTKSSRLKRNVEIQYEAYVCSQHVTNVLPVWSHMSMNNDIQTNPIGFYQCPVLHTILMVIFCKPEMFGS